MPLSDKYGRIFEFCVTRSIISRLEEMYPGKVSLTARAREAQLRGERQFKEFFPSGNREYEKAAARITEWLAEKKFKNSRQMDFAILASILLDSRIGRSQIVDRVELDRIPDAAGVQGDVTDVRIAFVSGTAIATVNISLKHSHTAFKHPRLTRVPEWVASANRGDTSEYLREYREIWLRFFQMGRTLAPTATAFQELKYKDPTFIEKNLYRPLYELVKGFLEKHTRTTRDVQRLFEFLVGTYDFMKFILFDTFVEVRDFSSIHRPASVSLEYGRYGYLYFNFDNGWRLSARLHTASEGLKESIKFDVQPAVDLDSLVSTVRLLL